MVNNTTTTTEALDNLFFNRRNKAINDIKILFDKLYATHPLAAVCFEKLLSILEVSFKNRNASLKELDISKNKNEPWFLSNQLCGMSLYVDRFAENLKGITKKMRYFEELGVNFLHLMPIFESPQNESDGGYAVSNFRKIDAKFGNIEDVKTLKHCMQQKNIFLMLDIVLNHTSHKHDWALRAKKGDKKYQDYFYFFDDRKIPDALEKTMPEIFPESSPGNFTYIKELDKWVMTVFHNYQWDLNYRNPNVFNEMLENIFFSANLGVDVLRIDAPAFLWKKEGTSSQNLEEAHTIIQLIKQCVQVVAPGMALLAEAIVSPVEIIKYFGQENYIAKESDFAYNATQMAVQWDALATGDTTVMQAAQKFLLQKPYGTSWITYTRCHDDIGLGYDDYMIDEAGYNAYQHRTFIKNYYSGLYDGSTSKGALFSVNEKTGDARISGTLASLCGLEMAVNNKDNLAIDIAIKKIILMQAQSFFIGGLPIIFYGDEVGYTNDYTYLREEAKSYDNRWMHRPLIDWEKNKYRKIENTVEQKIFLKTQKLINVRKNISVFSDKKNITWLNVPNKKIAAFLRAWDDERIYCIFNFSNITTNISWYCFKQNGQTPSKLYDHWSDKEYAVGYDYEYLVIEPYQFFILEVK